MCRTNRNRPAGLTIAVYLAGLGLLLSLGACSDRRDRPPNILLITVDTLRADRLHCYGCPVPTSPNVDALAAEGVLFSMCFAHASSTAPALASVMTGKYPTEAGVLNNTHPLSPAPDTLAAYLKRQDYVCAAFVSNFNLRRRMGFDRGFDHFDARLMERELNRSGVPERTAEKTTDATIGWLERFYLKQKSDAARPFFIWVHYQDPHGPYTPPEDYLPPRDFYSDASRTLPLLAEDWGVGGIPAYQALGEHRNEAHYRACYDGEVLFCDRHLGRLVKFLETAGLGDDTMVVFTADHGESMGEHERYFSHEQDLYNELIRVPLIITAPGIEPDRRDDIACHADIFPTLAGVTPTADDGTGKHRGRDLLAPVSRGSRTARRPIFSETNFVAERTRYESLILGRWKLVRATTGEGVRQLFDLEADLGETTNLAASRGDVLKQMEKLLKAEATKAQRAYRGTGPLELSPTEREALEALGYSDGS